MVEFGTGKRIFVVVNDGTKYGFQHFIFRVNAVFPAAGGSCAANRRPVKTNAENDANALFCIIHKTNVPQNHEKNRRKKYGFGLDKNKRMLYNNRVGT